MTDFNAVTVHLHSEKVTVFRREVNGQNFDLAVTNGRTKVWAERFFEIEPELLNWFTNLNSDDVLWDLGASIGHFAIYACLLTHCKVIAFDPDPQNFSILNLNQFLNREQLNGRFTALNFGIAPETRIADMSMRLFGAGEHTKRVHAVEGEIFRQKIALLNVTDVTASRIPPPTAVKIDVDGSEEIVLAALTGMFAGINRVFIEVPASRIEYFCEFFRHHGLTLLENHDVVRLSGGYYPQIRNLVFERGR
ncbi:FkbM family methyltransferase [Paramesorhizobium deserti]|uniref:FkbM family methyltransferase n=1 Tax=Paramesorhizobium deserti TaxID=1494590 RepID=UPI0013794F1F|nr:FkbM family methyltransferase [Paramesorhizobium deserti]